MAWKVWAGSSLSGRASRFSIRHIWGHISGDIYEQAFVNPEKTHPKEAKVLLGKTIVNQFYDKNAAEATAAEFDKVFAQGQLPEEIPEFILPLEPISVKQLLLDCKLVETGGEAKRMIKQSAASIDGEKLTDPNTNVIPKEGSVIRVGKRKFARLKVNS